MNVCEAWCCCCGEILVKKSVAAAKKIGQREGVAATKKFSQRERGVLRRRIYRKYASCKWLKDAGLEFTRADVVVSISRGPPGQWFPETEH